MILRAAAGLAIAAITLASQPTAPSSHAPRVELDHCASCHPAETAEWQASRHALAWRDPIFQAEFAHGRAAWCVGCHAPAAPDPTAPDEADPRVAQGVGCDACHRRDGRMVSGRRGPSSPHDTVVDTAFGSPEQCASCHEFNFPILGERGRLVRYTDEVMQATVSQARGASCLDCHADSPAGHLFSGSHDAERVADSLAVSLCRADGSLEVTLANEGAAHNVPTGGVHRRLVLRAWRSSAPERLAEHVLGRRFRPLDGGGKETISDTTIAAGKTRRARFTLAELGPADEPVNLELRYAYALDENDANQLIWSRRIAPAELAACP